MTSFERELKHRATVKSSPHISEENVLIKAFKYFDLADKGIVNKRQFVNTAVNIGVTNFSTDVSTCFIKDLARVFEFYDAGDTGVVNYRDMVKQLLSPNKKQVAVALKVNMMENDTHHERVYVSSHQHNNQSGRIHHARPVVDQKRVDNLISDLRSQFLRKGLFGLIRFAKSLKVAIILSR